MVPTEAWVFMHISVVFGAVITEIFVCLRHRRKTTREVVRQSLVLVCAHIFITT